MEREQELERRISELEELLAAALKRISEMEAELENYKKPPKDSSNSSIPPSRDQKQKYGKREKSDRKGGAQAGHPGHHHPFVAEPDVVEPVYPKSCEHCGCGDLQPLENYGEARQEVELPPLKPVVTEYRSYRGLCRNCGKVSRGEFPESLKAPVQMGSSPTALIGYLKQVHHISHERIVTFFNDIFNLSVSDGFVENRLDILEEDVTPTYKAIGEAIRQEAVLGSDETGQRVDGKNRYLWVFQSERYCYFVGNATRQFTVISDIFGKTFAGTWVSDRFGSQLKIEAKHQVCLAHVIRNLQYAIDAEQSEWATSLQTLLREAIHFRKQTGSAFDPSQNQDVFRQCEHYRQQLEGLFEKPPPLPQPEEVVEKKKKKKKKSEAGKLFDSLNGLRQSLLLFLSDPNVPYENNASERALRPLVVHRKVLGPARSEKGAKRQAVFSTLIETAKRMGKNVFDVLNGKVALQFS
jgi:transposase